MPQISAIPAFDDNYIWLLQRGGEAVLVDPGDAAPSQRALDEQGLKLVGILITHHHRDHTGGIEALTAAHRVPVFGPMAESARIPGLTRTLADGERVQILGWSFEVIAVPGHTLGHIAYYSAEAAALFCGDTLFSAGCGRLFEGSPEQMHASLQRLAALPPNTAVYCTHEYTLSNLAFAQAVEPDNTTIDQHLQRVRNWRAEGQPSLPSRIGLEREINPFLRSHIPAVRERAGRQAGMVLRRDDEVFGALRRWKDGFRAA